MDHYKLDDELRKQLIESAAWGKADITPRLDEDGKNGNGDEDEDDKGDKKAFGGKKGDKSKTKKGKKARDDEEDEEEVDEDVAHACPLCASELYEEIDENRLLEHLNVVVGLVDRLSQLQEGDEDIDSVIDETLAEVLLQDEYLDEE